MEGSETGVLVPSGTITEVETWVKFSKFPVEFLTVDALSMISSSIGSPVRMDEETYEKLEDAKRPPPLRRKPKLRRTFVRILVRVSVTEPLRPTVDVYCPQGRKYTIRLDYDPTPKVCLNYFCAGHFDFECCGTDKVSVEINAEAGEGFLDVNSQRADCLDGFRADINGEQGAVTTDELDSYEDSTVVEAALKVDSHIIPAVSCNIGAAAVPEMQHLLPATYIAHGVQGIVISEGSESYEDPPVLEVDPHNLPPAPCEFGIAVADLQAEVGELVAVQTISDGFDETSTVEIMEDDAEAGEDFLGVDLQLADCFDSMSDEVDGEQGAVTTDGVESYEDSTVVEAVKLPAATCDIGEALVGELEAVHTILDGLYEQSLVERTPAVLEVQPLLPATIAADGSEGTIISDGFVCFEDPPVVEVVLEVSPHCLPPASCEFGAAKVGDLEAVQTFSDRFDDGPLVGKEIAVDPLATVGESIAADLKELATVSILDGFDEEPTVERIAAVSYLVDEQVVGFIVLFPFEPGPFFTLQFIMDKVFNDYLIAAGNLFGLLFFSLKNSSIELSSFEDFSVVKSSRQHHKWREKTVEQRFTEGDFGSGERLLGVDMQDADCIGGIIAYIDGVQGAVIIDRAVCYENPPDFEAALVEDFHNIEQVFFVVKSSKKHHKWREKSDVQGLFCCSSVLGLSGFDEQPSVEIKETTAVLPFSDFGAANSGTSPAAILQGRADPCIDKDTFEELDVLQSLGRLMAATNSTHDQLIFKIQHKWRDKSMDWSADRNWVILMY